MSKLIHSVTGVEMFQGKSRGQINHMVSGHCKSDKCAELHQAAALHDLQEVFQHKYERNGMFSLESRARLTSR